MKIVYYDGLCPLCHRSVKFLMKADRKQILRFASFQGDTAKKYLNPELIGSLNTIIFQNNDSIKTHSDAILDILSEIKYRPWAIKMFKLFPKFARDLVYKLISKSRYKIFGKFDICQIPSAADRESFLD